MTMNRRKALRNLLTTAPALAASRMLTGQANNPVALAGYTGQIRIREVRVYHVKKLVVVGVVADDGTIGWGEAGHSGSRYVAKLVRDYGQSLVVGSDPFDTARTWHSLYYELDELGPGGVVSQAIAGIDCALWDLRGRLLQQPVWALIGGKFRSDFPLYGSFSRSLGNNRYMTAAQAAAKAAELAAEGFQAIKFRLGIREEGVDPDPKPIWEAIAAVRQAIGDKIDLYIDANNGYTPGQAIEVARRLHETYNVSVFEEPVAAYQYASLRKVSEAGHLLIAAGEHEYDKWDFRDLIQQGQPHILNPDISKCCGLTECIKVATLAEVFDCPISVHNARPTLLNAAHMHFVAASRMAYRPQEHPGHKRLGYLWKYFHNTQKHENGRMQVYDEPGLGLEVNEQALKEDAQ
ncbi:MAG: mandelate racemase/muconate lactonizing enzyme family protein [Bacteroidetes bacterium]|nr:MAG: mandelate racemase/muconate lactonizing enzyme family protein [Bacteroidota bacterium]